MKAIFIGSVHFSLSLLEKVFSHFGTNLVGIVTKEKSTFNSDFYSLKEFADQNGIDSFLYKEETKEAMTCWLTERSPDVIFCLGWSHLLDRSIMNIPSWGIIGYHPAALPYNRGRHPIIWAIALGLKETASTFFKMNEGADSGEIIDQRKILVPRSDNAKDLYDNLNRVAQEQIDGICSDLLLKKVKLTSQDHSKANYWRKRTQKDGIIDWRMSGDAIYNLVRALTIPYGGAEASYKNSMIKVWDCDFHTMDEDINDEPGKILDVTEVSIVVKCYDGIITIKSWTGTISPQVGEYFS